MAADFKDHDFPDVNGKSPSSDLLLSEKLSQAKGLSYKAVLAWAMYDWANSAYSTLLITVVLCYIQQVVLPGKSGMVTFAWAIGAAMLLTAILSPIVGAMADANRSKRRWLAITALGGAAAAILMALVPENQPSIVIIAFVLMALGFELSLTPYNGFLPEIADDQHVNRVSAWGFALGYIGGSIPLILAWLIIRYGNEIGLTDVAAQYRAGILLLGLWWAVFSLPSLLILRDTGIPVKQRVPFFHATVNAARQVGKTLTNIRRFPVLAMFLLAFLFYNDGIQTVITQANTMASRELHFSLDELFWLVLVIQLVALPGSLVVGWLSDYFGQKPVLLVCLAVWATLLAAAAVIESKAAFWCLGITLGLVLGGTQSVSRAMMSVLTPPAHAAEFFGFFNLSGKAASVFGPLQFGVVVYLTGSARLAAMSLLVFFLIGFMILMRIDIAEGRRQAA